MGSSVFANRALRLALPAIVASLALPAAGARPKGNPFVISHLPGVSAHASPDPKSRKVSRLPIFEVYRVKEVEQGYSLLKSEP